MIASSSSINVGRALMAAMQPITGARARGTVTLTTKPGSEFRVPWNSYWVPILNGERQTSWLYKVTRGPNADGSWTVTDAGATVPMMSNIGGYRHNVPAGTLFAPTVPIEELVVVGAGSPVAATDFEGATEPGDYCGVKDMVLYETFDGPAFSLDLMRSPISQFPGVLLAFQNLEPADGVAIAQNNQAAVNAGEGKKFYKVTYTISVITSKSEGDMARRLEGLIIADTIVQLLMDKKAGDPGECLSSPGGVQVRQMVREDGPQPVYKKFYIYTVLVSAMVLIERLDFRTFPPWLRAVLNVDKAPQIPAVAGQGPIRVVNDVKIDMTPNTLDLAIDGVFARASVAHLWRPENIEDGVGELLQFGSGERRVTNPANGIYLEPVIDNDLGAAGEDFSTWVVSDAVVTTGVEPDPDGGMGANGVEFDAGAGAFIESPSFAVPSGVPVVVQVFAKAVGALSTSRMRLSVLDAAGSEHFSDDIEVSNVWDLYRLEVTPTMAGAATFRIHNASDDVGRTVVAWGAMYDDGARDGPQYILGTKSIETLTFTPVGASPTPPANEVTPQALLSGSWRLRWRSPLAVLPDEIGTASGAPGRVLASVGDGVTELVTLRLVGTPASGGAELTLQTRGGAIVTVAGLEWQPGAEVWFTVDASGGRLEVQGSDNGDGVYNFAPYAADAVAGDFLSLGHLSDGSEDPTPGWYIAVDVGAELDNTAITPSGALAFLGNLLTYYGSILTFDP